MLNHDTCTRNYFADLHVIQSAYLNNFEHQTAVNSLLQYFFNVANSSAKNSDKELIEIGIAICVLQKKKKKKNQ